MMLLVHKLNSVHRSLGVNQGRKPKSPAHQISILSTNDHFFSLYFSLKTRNNLLGSPEFEHWYLWAQLLLHVSLSPPGAPQSGSRNTPALMELMQVHTGTGIDFAVVVIL